MTVAIVIVLAIIVIVGVWKATAVQDGTGCPHCDALACGEGDGHEHHEHHEHDHPDHAADDEAQAETPSS